MTSKRIKKQPEILSHRDSFIKRWNLQTPTEDFTGFKNRISVHLSRILKTDQIVKTIQNDLFYALGICSPSSTFELVSLDPFNDSRLSTHLSPFTGSLVEYFWNLEIIIGSYRRLTDKNQAQKMADTISEALELSRINAVLCWCGSRYTFYPKGAELLDDKLVNDNLNWLEQYPKARGKFDNALIGTMKKQNPREIIDSLRLALELFLKDFFSNNKSLEKQMSQLGQFLKDKKVATEISNMYEKLFDLHSKYNNNNVKHDDKCINAEIEFCIYLTGSFMRFLIQLKNIK